MARGDVYLIDIPYPRGTPGHEQVGTRPAVVVQADQTGPLLSTVIVVPLTGQLKTLTHPHTIRVESSNANGLDQASVLLVTQLRVVDRIRIIRKFGTLEQHYLDQLDAEIRRLLGLES